MKRLTTRLLLAFVVAGALVAPAAGDPILLFDYVGFDYESPDNDALFGGIGDGYKGLGEVPFIDGMLTTNQTTYQYTYYFDGLTL